MSTLRQTRLDNEWSVLQRLADFNPGLLTLEGRKTDAMEERFEIRIEGTPAPIMAPAGVEIMDSHRVTVQFPAYFPAVPMQVFVSPPVYHPNVHPESGFVCIWDRTSSGDSILDALVLLQKVITWELHNPRGDHVMQPEALERRRAPIPYRALRMPPDLKAELDARCRPPCGRRPRLSVSNDSGGS
jgi:ubiquitin-protein ligase